MGDVSLGQDPEGSDQLQYQRFKVTGGDALLKITFIGSNAANVNDFGIYTYSTLNSEPSNTALVTTNLFTSRVTPYGTVVEFCVASDNYFGFYLKNASPRGTTFYTENARNSDGGHDHFLMFDTNLGFLLAAENLPFNQNTGLLGDQDYNDFLTGYLTYADGMPLFRAVERASNPEPTMLGLVALATPAILLGLNRRSQRRPSAW